MKYEIEKTELQGCDCGCSYNEYNYLLKENGIIVYESENMESIYEGILNREGIEFEII